MAQILDGSGSCHWDFQPLGSSMAVDPVVATAAAYLHLATGQSIHLPIADLAVASSAKCRWTKGLRHFDLVTASGQALFARL
jgi:hypothetical protein